MEAGERAVAREHLLDGDPRVARPEEVDETAGADRVGAEPARLGDRLRLVLDAGRAVGGVEEAGFPRRPGSG